MSGVREPAARGPGRRELSIWLDTHFAKSIAGFLAAEFAIDARSGITLGLVGVSDTTIFETARGAGVDMILTKDEDFAPLVRHRGPPPCIILLRCGNLRNAALRELLRKKLGRALDRVHRGDAIVEIEP